MARPSEFERSVVLERAMRGFSAREYEAHAAPAIAAGANPVMWRGKPLRGARTARSGGSAPMCPHAAPPRALFQFPSETGMVVCCWRCAIRYPPMLRRSARIALLVGTLLALINHGDYLFQGRVTGALALKILLTYAVPFTVATWSALVNGRVREV